MVYSRSVIAFELFFFLIPPNRFYILSFPKLPLATFFSGVVLHLSWLMYRLLLGRIGREFCCVYDFLPLQFAPGTLIKKQTENPSPCPLITQHSLALIVFCCPVILFRFVVHDIYYICFVFPITKPGNRCSPGFFSSPFLRRQWIYFSLITS